MKRDRFERQIQTALRDYTIPLDTDALWLDIEKELNAHRRRKIFFWILLLASATALLTWLSIKSWAPDPTNTPSNPPTPIAQHQHESHPTPSNARTYSSQKPSTTTHSPLSSAAHTHTLPSPAAAPSPQNPITSAKPTTPSTKSTAPINAHSTPSQPTSKPQFIDVSPIALLSTATLHSTAPEALSLSPSPIPTADDDFIRNIPKSPWSRSVRLYAGLGMHQSTYSHRNPEYAEWAILRRQTEKPLEALSATLAHQWTYKNSFHIQVGLQYLRLTSNFQHEFLDRSNTPIVDTIIEYLHDGSVNVRYSERYEELWYKYNTYTYYHFLTGELRFGYTLPIGRSLRISPFLGATLTGYQFAHGYQTTPNALVGRVSDPKVNPGFRAFGTWWLTTSIEVQYLLSPSNAMALAIDYRTTPTGIMKANNPIQQRFHSAFFRLGYHYLL